ncbi:acyl-CoA dehydrogenase family protein [Dietzia sp.]|uniref:acyl-CoA dehydrogenase family protein n=1 Tax=Dietzia sp. TaxID=1871616 RepID=UPI002FDA78E0
MAYKVPFNDIKFSLHNVLDAVPTLQKAGIEIDRETFDDVLQGYGEFMEQAVAPINLEADKEGAVWSDGEVTTPKGYKKAWDEYVAAGWNTLGHSEEFGGGDMPYTLSSAANESCAAASSAWSMFAGLTNGAIMAIEANATDELKNTYLPKMVTGEWTGAMCLTEPQAGTDLGLLTTKAQPNEDGSYAISGNKIFISAGQQDFTENIVHLVLARTPDAPAGTRGISLFLVPRNEVDAEGNVGANNNVFCDGIEHKMGIHGSPTCQIRFENARGWLVGEENRGLPAMFVMMNHARIGTAMQGLSISTASAQLALDYSRERIQSRAPKSVRGDRPKGSDPIVLQPDVRRMLLEQKAWIGAYRMLMHWITLQFDIGHAAGVSEEDKARAIGFVELLTPVGKGFGTDIAVDVASLGVQIHGGMGYVHETGAELYLRDARILPIYEGTNGVQALDLIGRKIAGDMGERFKAFLELVRENAKSAPEGFGGYAETLVSYADSLEAKVMESFAQAGENDVRVLAAATPVLRGFGYIAFGHFWLLAAKAGLEAGAGDEVAAQHVALAKFYFEWLLPQAESHINAALSSTEVLMDDAAIAY